MEEVPVMLALRETTEGNPNSEFRNPKEPRSSKSESQKEKAKLESAKERFRQFDRSEESGRGQPHSRTLARNRTLLLGTLEIYGPTEPRASVLECGCPLPLSPATMSLFLAPHPATFFRCCFESGNERFAKFLLHPIDQEDLARVSAGTVKLGDFDVHLSSCHSFWGSDSPHVVSYN